MAGGFAVEEATRLRKQIATIFALVLVATLASRSCRTSRICRCRVALADTVTVLRDLRGAKAVKAFLGAVDNSFRMHFVS
jgi:hypothetical protein